MACLEGYLKKRNTKKESKFLQNWNKRWFELTNQTLTYAKTPKDISAGSVQVYSVADIVAVNVKSDKEFEVSPGGCPQDRPPRCTVACPRRPPPPRLRPK
mmetsp:Transcript_12724/g.40230  ORF Transcript_12724/g.40230 Transcript_12724/m.40230 type:complete len:100 (-) Transcript_12724:917-1216(-)